MRIENGVLLSVTNSDIPSDGNFVIPDSVTEIGYYAFLNCTSLESITVSNNVTEIGDSAFYNCTSLTTITIPDSVTQIGKYAFCDCASLKSIKLSNKIKNIKDSTFSYCESLTTITIPSSVTSIGYYAFRYCTSLESIKIPDSVTSIKDYVFLNCKSLKSVTIPNSVTYIGEYAFFECTSLTSVNDLPCKYVDSIPMIITSQKQVSEYMIYKGHCIEKINSKEKSYFYVAEKDGFTAHGKTAKEAIEDLIYKITRDKLAKEPIYLDTVMTVDHYRAITGACSFGVNQWMQENRIKESDKLTVKQLLPILEKTNAYGFKKFKELIKDN